MKPLAQTDARQSPPDCLRLIAIPLWFPLSTILLLELAIPFPSSMQAAPFLPLISNLAFPSICPSFPITLSRRFAARLPLIGWNWPLPIIATKVIAFPPKKPDTCTLFLEERVEKRDWLVAQFDWALPPNGLGNLPVPFFKLVGEKLPIA